MTALWREIHLLEERVEVLENALETSRDQIARTEEKYDKLQKLGNFPFSANPRFFVHVENLLLFFRSSRRAFEEAVGPTAARC